MYAASDPSFSLASPSEAWMVLAPTRLDCLRADANADPSGPGASVGIPTRGEAGVFVRNSNRGDGLRAADQITKQPEDDDRRDEQQGQRPAVAPELLEQPSRDGADPTGAHDSSLGPARRKNASSRLLLPPRSRTSVGVPSANTFPYWIKPSRWQRSASSITWLETMIVVPPSAIRRKSSQSSTRNCGSTPTVGSSSSSTLGLCTRAHASDSRCRMPPLRLDTTVLRRPSSRTSSSASVTPPSTPLMAAKNSAFSSTESPG